MGIQFVENQFLETIACCNCGILFAMPDSLMKAYRADPTRYFYCPAGHRQHFSKSTEARLREELAKANEKIDRANARTNEVRVKLTRVKKMHHKMRIRVANGVCPCCNRSFDNLRQHMAGQHPEFREGQALHAMREAFGMSQGDVAEEVGVSTTSVSNYERNIPVSENIKSLIEKWMACAE